MTTKLLIFGITGDLSRRKLLPALREIYATGDFDDLKIIGVSRREVDITELLQGSLDDASLADKVSIFSMDLAHKDDYLRLKEYIDLQDDEQLVAYMSVPPSATTQIVDFMGEAGITTPNVKLLFEKPFGMDYESAKDVLARTGRYYSEEQIFRIDHYLAKEMAQNVVAFRGRNALFAHLWDKQSIQSIEIIASENIGIEGRAQFYEQTGALRDVVQGHLMQLLALVLMDIPEDFDWNELPKLRLQALQQVTPANPAKALRAQYEGYPQEVENLGSRTETYVSLELESTDPKWHGVPIRLVTGKALKYKTTEIRIHLRKTHDSQSNQITFHIQPNEGIDMQLYIKKPGYAHEFETRTLGFSYPENTTLPDAYEQVLVDAMNGRKNLFTGSGEVLRSWEILQPLQTAWDMDDAAIATYPKLSHESGVSS